MQELTYFFANMTVQKTQPAVVSGDRRRGGRGRRERGRRLFRNWHYEFSLDAFKCMT